MWSSGITCQPCNMAQGNRKYNQNFLQADKEDRCSYGNAMPKIILVTNFFSSAGALLNDMRSREKTTCIGQSPGPGRFKIWDIKSEMLDSFQRGSGVKQNIASSTKGSLNKSKLLKASRNPSPLPWSRSLENPWNLTGFDRWGLLSQGLVLVSRSTHRSEERRLCPHQWQPCSGLRSGSNCLGLCSSHAKGIPTCQLEQGQGSTVSTASTPPLRGAVQTCPPNAWSASHPWNWCHALWSLSANRQSSGCPIRQRTPYQDWAEWGQPTPMVSLKVLRMGLEVACWPQQLLMSRSWSCRDIRWYAASWNPPCAQQPAAESEETTLRLRLCLGALKAVPPSESWTRRQSKSSGCQVVLNWMQLEKIERLHTAATGTATATPPFRPCGCPVRLQPFEQPLRWQTLHPVAN